MSLEDVERVAEALLYEGYMLYPYRPTSVKNRQRFNFGVLYSPAYVKAQSGAEAASMQTECLLRGDDDTCIETRVRFLHLQERTVHETIASRPAESRPVAQLTVGDNAIRPWREAVQREVAVRAPLGDLVTRPAVGRFTFHPSELSEAITDDRGLAVGSIVRRKHRVDGSVELSAEACGDGLYRVRVTVSNGTDVAPGAVREDALLDGLVSAHTILLAGKGEFVSLLEPPAELRDLAHACRNIGTWPVLAGAAGERTIMLSSPIIIYDYPQLAPESPGDLFDGTEIDEILSLRILTLTDAEKAEMRYSDERARRILERTEGLNAEDLMRMHGTMRPVSP